MADITSYIASQARDGEKRRNEKVQGLKRRNRNVLICNQLDYLYRKPQKI